MSVLSGFYRTSYSINGKRASFYARKAGIPELGRRTVVHEYPNSDNRYVEDLGKIAGKFTLEIEIQETTASAYKRSRNALMTTLEQQGIGTLIHPTLGKKEVVPIPSSMTEDFINDNGIVAFSITFLESTLNIFPTSTEGSKGFLATLYDKTFGDSESVFGQALNYYDQGIELWNQGRDYLQDTTDTINDVVSTLNGVADEVAAFSADIKSFSSSIITLMQTPTTLASRFTEIFNGLATITDDFKAMTDIVLQIFGSNDRTKTNGTSALATQLNLNKISTANYVDVSCLTIAYLATTNIDYTSQQEIDEMMERLNDAFDSLDPDSVDEDVYYNLQDMRTQNRLLLQNLRTTIPYYVSLTTNSVPSAILSYNLYGSSSRSSEIDSLNGIEDPSFVSGNINVLSS
jgi:prophage DNA circulation protein